MQSFIDEALSEAKSAIEYLLGSADLKGKIAQSAIELANCFKADGRAFSCGNGGSMCDAMHFAEELSGRFRQDREPLPAQAISDPGYLSCTANDYSWEAVFARYLKAHGRRGDVLLAISTSGKSPNVLAAARQAKAQGMLVIALCGRPGSALAEFADIELAVWTGTFADRVQELHIKVIHLLIELTERQLFPANYR